MAELNRDMMKYGFFRVATAIPTLKVADCGFNAGEIVRVVKSAAMNDVSIVVFPELSITGYTCGDLFLRNRLRRDALSALSQILSETADLNIISIVGLPIEYGTQLFNAAAVIYGGEILGIVPKSYIPNYSEFYEQRWFASGAGLTGEIDIPGIGKGIPIGVDLIFSAGGAKFGVEICEDYWAANPCSTSLWLNGAEMIFNLSASPDGVGKYQYLKELAGVQSARTIAAYIYSASGFGESTTATVFAGNGLIYENGGLLAEAERFALESQLIFTDVDLDFLRSERIKNTTFREGATIYADDIREVEFDYEPNEGVELMRHFDPHPFIRANVDMNAHCENIFSIQSMSLAKRLKHTGTKRVVIGISGGLDSTLALLVAVRTFDILGLDRSGVIGITMPGFGTTGRTHDNAVGLMKALGVTTREISIKSACLGHFADIGHDANTIDVAYENAQARERTQILMDVANMEGALVVGTGDMSELALGWATFNGDHISMYGVNAGVPKTVVRRVVEWYAECCAESGAATILKDILATPISPELIPSEEGESAKDIAQKTEDIVGPYELHDYFLYYFMRYGYSPDKILYIAERSFAGLYSKETILKWLKIFFTRFFAQQYKRNCSPDGVKVGSVSLTTTDWRMASDASVVGWLNSLEEKI